MFWQNSELFSFMLSNKLDQNSIIIVAKLEAWYHVWAILSDYHNFETFFSKRETYSIINILTVYTTIYSVVFPKVWYTSKYHAVIAVVCLVFSF